MKALSAVFAILAIAFVAASPIQVHAQQRNGKVMVSVTEMTATVEDVDKDNRILTLKGPVGRELDVKVGAQVKNFDQIAKGDKVMVEYFQSVALSLRKEAAPPAEFAKFVEVTPTGEGKPAAVKAATLQVAATIENIDKEKREVTLRGPRGNTMVLTAEPGINLDDLSKGDQILATFTESVAVTVKKTS